MTSKGGRLGLTLMLALLALPLLPSAEALQLAGTLPLEVGISPTSGAVGGFGDILFISGSVAGNTLAAGPHAFLNTSAEISGAQEATVRPFEPRTLRQLEGESFENATLFVDPGATVLWIVPESVLEITAPYAFSAVVDQLSTVEEVQRAVESTGLGPISPTLMTIGESVRSVETPQAGNATSYLFLMDGDARLRVGNVTRDFPREHVFALSGPVVASFLSEGALVPIVEDGTVGFGRAGGEAFTSGFDLSRVTRLASDVQTLRTGSRGGEREDQEPDLLGGFGAVLNGAIFGAPNGTVTVAGKTLDEPGLTIVRFTELTLTRDSGQFRLVSEATLAYTAGEVRSDRSTVALGPLVVPVLAIPLFVVAIGAFLAARVYRFRPEDEALSEKLRLPALLSHIVLLALAFILFDAEVRYVTGVSLLGALGLAWVPPATVAPLVSGAAPAPLAVSGVSIGTAALLVLLPWFLSLFFFALPVKVTTGAGLRMGGLDKRARGFARGLGDLFAWVLGAGFIAAFLAGPINALAQGFAGG